MHAWKFARSNLRFLQVWLPPSSRISATTYSYEHNVDHSDVCVACACGLRVRVWVASVLSCVLRYCFKISCLEHISSTCFKACVCLPHVHTCLNSSGFSPPLFLSCGMGGVVVVVASTGACRSCDECRWLLWRSRWAQVARLLAGIRWFLSMEFFCFNWYKLLCSGSSSSW